MKDYTGAVHSVLLSYNYKNFVAIFMAKIKISDKY